MPAGPTTVPFISAPKRPHEFQQVVNSRQGMRSGLFLLIGATLWAQQTPDVSLFESKIRPTLAAKCYGCHSSKLKAPMGALVLDTKAGMQKGGDLGPVVVPGKPAESQLLKAL